MVVEDAELNFMGLRVNGDIAWATCYFIANTKVHADDSQWILALQGSFVLRRQGGTWKIALEHFSPIEGTPRVRRR